MQRLVGNVSTESGANTMRKREVVITGLGPLLPNCDSRECFWRQVSLGQSQLTLEEDPSDHSRQVPQGRIRDFDPSRYLGELPEKHYRRYHREQQLYLASVLLARDDAGLDLGALPPERVGLFDGSSRGNFAFWYEKIRSEHERPLHESYTPREVMVGLPGQAVAIAAAALKIRGPAFSFNGSCSAGAIAIGHAFRELLSGRIDVAFGTGHDVPLVAPIYQMYKTAELLAQVPEDPRSAVRPYVDHSRNALAEGAVTLVLETREHAERRGARILATMGGFEYGNTGVHPTDVDTTGVRPAQLIEALLAGAELAPEQIRFVVGHGNAAPESDRSEYEYMKRVFGTRTARVPLVSVKPIYGHPMGASSAISVAAAALMVHQRFVAPTINVDAARVTPGFDHQANVGKPDPCDAGVVVNFGIGGQNTAFLLQSAGGPS
ncbi:MAG: beta-ketoacyl-[acyl-carrier-protein] synthase family protein [Myxococcaceae bacterium]